MDPDCAVCGDIAMHVIDPDDVDFITVDDLEAGVGVGEIALCIDCYQEVMDVGWDTFTGGG